MGWFLPSITQAKLDNQRDVVKNERRQSYENRPYGLANETVLRHGFPAGHPYRHPTIGYMEDLDRASLSDVRAFFEHWYAPGNAVLVLCGDFAPDSAWGAVERYFGDIPPRPSPRKPAVPQIDRGWPEVVRLEDSVSVPRVYSMYHAPSFTSDEYETAKLLASVLAGGRSSRLYRDLVYERRMAANVYAFVWPLEQTGMLWLVATARPGVSAEALREGIDRTLGDLAERPPSEEEVEGARRRARRQLLLNLEGVGGRASFLAHAAVLRHEPEYLNRVFDRYGAVGADAIADLSKRVLARERRTGVDVVPGGAEQVPAPGGRT
jgi:zinc protease